MKKHALIHLAWLLLLANGVSKYVSRASTDVHLFTEVNLFYLVMAVYLPIQNLLKILSKTDSVTSSPVISPKA